MGCIVVSDVVGAVTLQMDCSTLVVAKPGTPPPPPLPPPPKEGTPMSFIFNMSHFSLNHFENPASATNICSSCEHDVVFCFIQSVGRSVGRVFRSLRTVFTFDKSDTFFDHGARQLRSYR